MLVIYIVSIVRQKLSQFYIRYILFLYNLFLYNLLCIPCKILLPVSDFYHVSLSGGKYMHANLKRDIVCQST